MDKMTYEKSLLLNLKEIYMEEQICLLEFFKPGTVLETQTDKLRTIVQNKEAILEKVNMITLLPSSSDKVKMALYNISALENLQKVPLESLYDVIDKLLTTLEVEISSLSDFKFEDIESKILQDHVKSGMFIYNIANVKDSLAKLGDILSTSTSVISKQYNVIDSQIKRIEDLSLMIIVIFVISIISAAVIISLLVAKGIALSIRKIGSSVTVMASGDLTKEFQSHTKDEIEVLSEEMNQFQTGLKLAFNQIKLLSSRNTETKDELISTATETSASAEQIAANILSINNQMSSLDKNIGNSSQQIQGISGITSELNSFISDQMAMVEESTASITEMISSISSVSQLTDKNRTAMNSLVDTAGEGGSKLTETTGIIEEINDSVNEINSMAGIIQNISAQTNLLAMNAAIEAAHAGDSGKGFAVVADEIRKLAEISSVNSKQISRSLKAIINRIEQASESGKNTSAAFMVIDKNVKEVSEALDAISSSTVELNVGGTQILEAMSNLGQISIMVQDKSGVMKQDSDTINSSIKEVSNISRNVADAVSEISVGIREVSEAINGLRVVSEKVDSVSIEIDREIHRFITISYTDSDPVSDPIQKVF